MIACEACEVLVETWTTKDVEVPRVEGWTRVIVQHWGAVDERNLPRMTTRRGWVCPRDAERVRRRLRVDVVRVLILPSDESVEEVAERLGRPPSTDDLLEGLEMTPGQIADESTDSQFRAAKVLLLPHCGTPDLGGCSPVLCQCACAICLRARFSAGVKP